MIRINPWDKGNPCDKVETMASLPTPSSAAATDENRWRVVATLSPHPAYWQQFHSHWIHQVGEARFLVKRDSFLCKRNNDGFWYFALCLECINYTFPVQQPHVTIGKFQFDSYHEMWTATIKSLAFLYSRIVLCQFCHYGRGLGFKLMAGNELYALAILLRQVLQENATHSTFMVEPHISWDTLMKY